ncbi:hypothetical protein Trydic_g14523 [Trypoxylus dichotomus]
MVSEKKKGQYSDEEQEYREEAEDDDGDEEEEEAGRACVCKSRLAARWTLAAYREATAACLCPSRRRGGIPFPQWWWNVRRPARAHANAPATTRTPVQGDPTHSRVVVHALARTFGRVRVVQKTKARTKLGSANASSPSSSNRSGRMLSLVLAAAQYAAGMRKNHGI